MEPVSLIFGEPVYDFRPFGAGESNHCRVYWGSHGCSFERGHEGDCACDCCECRNHPDPDSGCVARVPYYGKITRFYGEDAEVRGLPVHDQEPPHDVWREVAE
jgi:hypothetical protein